MDAEDLIKAVHSEWPRPIGLALGFATIITLASLATSLIPKIWALVLAAAAIAALIFCWLYQRQLKRCPRDKFGFVIAFSVDDRETERVFERDFVRNLTGLLESGVTGERIWVYQIPPFLLPHPLNDAQAVALRKQLRANFVLHGQVRTRFEGARKHYIDLSGVVGHAETTKDNKDRLAKEFAELLPRRLVASEGEELPAFELTSSVSSVVAKYIAGIGAFLSGFVDYSDAMYRDALALATPLSAQHDVAKKILARIPTRKSEVAIARATERYNEWKGSRSPAALQAMGEFLDEAPEIAHEIPQWKVLKAISLVSSAGDDLSKVESLVLKMPENDPVTHVNRAFFDVVRGDLKSATRRYRKSGDLNITMDSIEEVMSFLEWFLSYRPSCACQVNFALGYISYYLLRDFDLAADFFSKFNEQSLERFSDERALIPKWLGEIKP